VLHLVVVWFNFTLLTYLSHLKNESCDLNCTYAHPDHYPHLFESISVSSIDVARERHPQICASVRLTS